jgi:hypothetical protein
LSLLYFDRQKDILSEIRKLSRGVQIFSPYASFPSRAITLQKKQGEGLQGERHGVGLLNFARKKEENPMPKKKTEPTLMECLEEVPDPRVERCRRHKLIDILFIALCAIMCGAESFTEMEDFGEAKEAWLRQFSELPNGIPSPDTFRRVLGRLNPQAVPACVLRWVRGVVPMTGGHIVPIDGKTVRRSHNKAIGSAAISINRRGPLAILFDVDSSDLVRASGRSLPFDVAPATSARGLAPLAL